MFRMAIFLVLSSFTLLAGSVAAQNRLPSSPDTPRVLRAGVYVSPPFAMQDAYGYSGMAVELWDTIAGGLGLQAQYSEYDTVSDLVRATANGEIDVAITNLTITKGRAELMDFTHPWFDAGLRIMVNEEQGTGFWHVLDGLQASGHLRAYGWIAVIILVATVLLTFFDRRCDMSFPESWREGIAESFYTVMSVATSGKPAKRNNLFGWVGRIWGSG